MEPKNTKQTVENAFRHVLSDHVNSLTPNVACYCYTDHSKRIVKIDYGEGKQIVKGGKRLIYFLHVLRYEYDKGWVWEDLYERLFNKGDSIENELAAKEYAKTVIRM
ncbi:hypothetical protein EO98_17155 [Methanosarcina sp. 2.H.T.1A.6]|uniref:hypothetical protein n=1 Tax=unclassified Methanosarcina TaxID=2644672 RepID=UPI0006215E23|nr:MULTISPECIES: hypothetical protein [unclassified Methanosarcina]KKG15080.1 hypothetical protein EO94_04210 [Methanosarcina sp. 2.H.T.1A.3]KKG19343.1 hypothetical protein EO97_04125 [Methanosarcina sp. 2.H.T.1A.15]KKG20779.1 hypothetical protein EO96_18200 [Methanosarcina sp. 2.H.T.1A.8]KKG22096.1 hypothetical protein EO98_17155 [Methanosarcina sp. 2.H.T.1A.6]